MASSFKRFALLAALAHLCLAHAQTATVSQQTRSRGFDPIDAICKRYTGVGVMRVDGADRTLPCDVIHQIADSMKRPQTLMHGLYTKLQAERPDVREVKNAGPGCVEQRQGTQWTVSCPLVVQGAQAKLIFGVNSLGYVESITASLPDFRPLLVAGVDEMEAKMPGVVMTPEGWHLMMDLLVANNNAIASPLENYRRQGNSLTVKMTKIPN